MQYHSRASKRSAKYLAIRRQFRAIEGLVQLRIDADDTEGAMAFMLEAGFLGIMLFGWNRVSRKMFFI